jgi:uncharacterized protein
MTDQIFRKSIRISRPSDEVFAWHERPFALERLTPPWERVEVVSRTGGIRDGDRVVLRSKLGPFWQTWEVEHRDYKEGSQFRDVQRRGPFASWEHLHQVESDGASACTLTDEIRYRLPGGALGAVVAGGFARGKLEQLFAYRHAVMEADLSSAARYGAVRGMRFLVSGASGLVGRALVPFLRSQGHEVFSLVRRQPRGPNEVFWAPSEGRLDLSRLRSVDAVIHLAGENVGQGRWTARRRAAILKSRVASTRTLVSALGALRHRPFVFVSASATGFYGDRGDHVLREGAPAGRGFLTEVCQAWEHEVAEARGLGMRAVSLRTGVVLDPRGGALAKMLPLFRSGLGGRLGSGRQWMSWIAIDDLLGAFYHTVLDRRCSGPVNAVSPRPVTNAEFTATLARVLRRPALLPVPELALTGALGQMARETVLASTRVLPERLLEAQYAFRLPALEDALRHVLGRRLRPDQT